MFNIGRLALASTLTTLDQAVKKYASRGRARSRCNRCPRREGARSEIRDPSFKFEDAACVSVLATASSAQLVTLCLSISRSNVRASQRAI